MPELSGIVKRAIELGVNTVNVNAIYNTPQLELETDDYNVFKEENEKATKLAKDNNVKFFMHITDGHFAQKGENKSRHQIIDYLDSLPKVERHTFSGESFNTFLENNTLPPVPFHWIDNIAEHHFPDLDNIMTFEWQHILNKQDAHAASLENPGDNFKMPFCLNPWNLLYVKEDGSVRLCCNSDRFIGDLSTHSIQEIYNNNTMQQIRRSMLDLCPKPPECVNCKAGNRYLGKENLC
jgi:hypothetical protein